MPYNGNKWVYDLSSAPWAALSAVLHPQSSSLSLAFDLASSEADLRSLAVLQGHGQLGHPIHGQLLFGRNGRHVDRSRLSSGPKHMPNTLVPEPLRHGRPERAQLGRNSLIRLHRPPGLAARLLVRRSPQGADRRLGCGGQARDAGRVRRTFSLHAGTKGPLGPAFGLADALQAARQRARGALRPCPLLLGGGRRQPSQLTPQLAKLLRLTGEPSGSTRPSLSLDQLV